MQATDRSIRRTDMTYLKLCNGVEMPQLGFGVFQISERETKRAVLAARC